MKPNTTGFVQFKVRVPPDLYNRMTEAAVEDDRSLTSFIRVAIRNELARRAAV